MSDRGDAKSLNYIRFMVSMMCDLLGLADIWAGHVMRIEKSDSAKEVLCTRLGGNEGRRRGRPKSSDVTS